MKILLTTFFQRSISIEGGERIINSYATAYEEKGIRVTTLCSLKKTTASSHIYFKPRKNNYILDLIDYSKLIRAYAKKFDAVHIITTAGLCFLGDICAKNNQNTIVTLSSPIITLDFKDLKIQYIKHFLVKNKLMTMLSAFKAKKYFVETNFQKNQLLKLGVSKKKIKILSWGLVSSEFNKMNKEEMKKKYYGNGQKKVIGYIGHFHTIKGVKYLVEAFSKLAKKRDDLLLALAWSGKGNEKIIDLIKKRRLKGRVKILGKVKVNEFISSLDIIVLPYTFSSLPHPPLVMIEAFAVGCPVITTDVGGLRDIITDKKDGLIVKPRSTEAIIKAINCILTNKTYSDTISKNEMRTFKDRYDISNIIKQYISEMTSDNNE